jgi:hypothetical protein
VQKVFEILLSHLFQFEEKVENLGQLRKIFSLGDSHYDGFLETRLIGSCSLKESYRFRNNR